MPFYGYQPDGSLGASLYEEMPRTPPKPPPAAPKVQNLQNCPVDIAKYLGSTAKPSWMAKAAATRDALLRNKANFPERILEDMPTPGVPPAPIRVYGNEKAVLAHAYQWDPNSVMGLHFRPDRHTVMIQGRPMQAGTLC